MEQILERHRRHAELRQVAERLVAEFAAVHPPGAVMRAVSRSRERLITAGVRHGLVPAVEAMTRADLHGRMPRASLS